MKLSDEVLHLAAALQFGGFRPVIATLWPVGDTTAQAVARQIYAALATGERFDPGQSAVAVRDVTLRLRARHPDSPMLWAPFVHIGP